LIADTGARREVTQRALARYPFADHTIDQFIPADSWNGYFLSSGWWCMLAFAGVRGVVAEATLVQPHVRHKLVKLMVWISIFGLSPSWTVFTSELYPQYLTDPGGSNAC
jgi:hypothetical protein